MSRGSFTRIHTHTHTHTHTRIYSVAQKVSHYQIIKKLYYIVLKSAHEIRILRQIKEMIKHYNIINVKNYSLYTC